MPSSTALTSMVAVLESQLYEREFCVAGVRGSGFGRGERACFRERVVEIAPVRQARDNTTESQPSPDAVIVFWRVERFMRCI